MNDLLMTDFDPTDALAERRAVVAAWKKWLQEHWRAKSATARPTLA